MKNLFRLVLFFSIGTQAHATVTYDGTDGVFSDVFSSNSENACTNCHSSSLVGAVARSSAPTGVDFDTYANATSSDNAERASIRVNAGTMPPSGSLNASEMSLIAQWITDGKAENAAPEVTSSAATSVSKYQATFNGTVSEGGANTTVEFNYGTASNSLTNTKSATSPSGTGGGESAPSVAATQTSLSCGTTYFFRLEGTNSVGSDNGSTLNFTTDACNVAPTITSTAGTAATEDIQYSYQVTVSDSDDSNNGTDLTFLLSNEPTGMTVSSTGLIRWTPTEGVTTSGVVTVQVQDGGEDGASPDTENFTVTVTAVNDPPSITSTAGTAATEDQQYSYQVTVSDVDDSNNGTDITFALSNEPSGMVVSSTGLITWTPAEGVTTSGTVTLTVSDGGEDGAAADTENFTVTVDTVNDAPVISSTAGTTATEDIQYSYQVSVTDPDDSNNGTDLSFSLSGEPSDMAVSATGLITWTATEGVTTSGVVTVTVTDGGEDGAAADTENFTVTVTAVNDAPTITSTASTSATEDIQYSYQVTVSDPDDSNNGTDITFALSNEPTGMVVSGTGLITWTPTNGVSTSGNVTLTVSDGGEDGAAADTENFTITVDAENDPPTITSTAGTTATEDIQYSYQVTVNDPDDSNNGTDLTFSLSGEPSGMTASSTGLITWTATEGVSTSGSVTVTVADGGENGAAADTENFTVTVTAVNDAPTITSTASTSATEDIQYSYQVTVSDPDDSNNGTDITFALSNEPAGMVVSSTGLITWTPTNGVSTSGNVTLTVSDGGEDGAAADTENFTVTVDAENDPPTITSTAGTTATEDIQYSYQVTVSDPDDTNNGSDISFSLSNAPTGMSVSNTGLVTWTPLEGVLTSGAVTLTVADGGENGSVPDTENFTVTVTSVNDSPVISSSASTSAIEDSLYSYQLVVTDPDDSNNGTDLTFALSNEPTGMTISTTGLVQWTPANGVLTSGEVTVTVSDGGENSSVAATQSWTITVDDVNDPPVISSTAGTAATEDVEYQYQVSVTDPDDSNNGTDISFTLTNAPTGMSVSVTGLVSWTPLEGVLTSGLVTLTVADGGESGAVPDTENFTITVTSVNDSPVISSAASTSGIEDDLYSYQVTVTDPDDSNNGTDLTFALSNEPTGMTVSSTGLIQWTPANGVLTSGEITITVNDGGEDSSVPGTQSWTIAVDAVNDPPVITSTAGTAAIEDTEYQYQVEVADPDDTNNGTDITFSLTNAPTGMSVSSTGLITWTPLEGVLTSGSVTVSAADGGESGSVPSTEDFTVTVTPVNDAPTISSSPSTSAVEDEVYSYQVTVSDPDDSNNGTDLTFALSNEPAGMTVSSTGLIAWTPTNGVTTSNEVTLTVTDGGEDSATSASQSWTVTVDAVNDAPTITSTAGTTATEDVEYQYQVTVSDPDDTNNGTDITFTLTNAPEGMTVSNTGLVRWTPVEGVLTSGQVTLTVADGGESDAVAATELFTVSVTPVDNAPAITSTAVTSATEDVLYQYEVAATDEEGTSLTFSLTTSPAGMTIGAASGVIDWTPTEGITSEAVVVSVTDGTHTVTQSYAITVTAVNDQPVFTSTPVTIATEDLLYQYPLAASDPENTALVYSLASAPDGMTVDANSGLIGWTPTEGVLSGSVTASVTDGELTDSQSFTITVTPVNDGVSVTAIADQSVTELSNLSVALTVADVDDTNNGTDIGFELLNAPSGMTVSNLGIISWTPGQSTSGAYSVVVRVFDGLEDNAQAAEASMNVTVIKLDTDTDTVADYLDNCPDAANTDQLDTDADGLGNVCDSDDDGDGISDVAELANGLDPLDSSDAALDLDQDGLNNLAEFELCSASQDGECTAINQDTVAPVITLTTPVTFDATDYLTPIKVTVTANDVLDGAVDVTLAEGSKNLRPGVHTLVWAATDAAGNRGTQSQTVNIRPLVNLGGSTVIGEGREVSVQVKLSGEGISYPVTASVSTSGDVSASDFTLNTTSVEIGESGETNLLVSVVSDGVIESDETLILTLEEVSSNAVLPASANYQILIVDRNVAPEAALSLTQNDQTVSTVYKDGGAVLVSLSVTDANMDATTSDWQTSTVNGTLSDDLSSFSFDPSGLEAGKSYQLSVDVSDGVAITRVFVRFPVAANQPVLDAANDSDGDGIDDVTEGLGDSDGDGVADYQDAVNDPTRLSAGNSAAETSNLMAVGTGLQMSLGSTALGQGQGGAFIGSDAVTDDDGNVIKDGDFNVIGGLYDFVVKGLSEAKRTAQVVIPLAQSVPADASYRKFSDGQWFEFIENGTDFIQSANKVDGVCPLPGSALYQTGLLRFADCLQLNISDGGPNDADGEVNGVIVDPSGVAAVASASDSESVSAPTEQPSGSGSLGWWSFLVLLTLLVRKQFRFFLTLLLKRTS